jgi:hypothetical protein
VKRAIAAFALALIGAGVSGVPAEADVSGSARPCRYEDGPGPCVWDALHRGNGEGMSVKVNANGSWRNITHRRAARLLYGCSS